MSIVFGLYLVFSSYLSEKKNKAYENIGFVVYNDNALKELDNETTGEVVEPDPDPQPDPTPNPTPTPNPKPPVVNPANNYIGILQIDKINLKRGFVDPSSKYNNIQYNVTIIKGSSFPDVENGVFILAAHSGSGPLAIFKDLYLLKVGDIAKVTYKNKLYVYKIVKIYNQKKQGYVEVQRDGKKTTLMLVTCTKNNKQSQTVYIAELT